MMFNGMNSSKNKNTHEYLYKQPAFQVLLLYTNSPHRTTVFAITFDDAIKTLNYPSQS